MFSNIPSLHEDAIDKIIQYLSPDDVIGSFVALQPQNDINKFKKIISCKTFSTYQKKL